MMMSVIVIILHVLVWEIEKRGKNGYAVFVLCFSKFPPSIKAKKTISHPKTQYCM